MSDFHSVGVKPKMQMIDFTLHKDHSVLSPNFGDAELRGIAFPTSDAVALSIWLSVGEIVITIECRNVRWFAFQSHHMQNVINSVSIYPDLRTPDLPRGLELPDYVTSEYLRVSDSKIAPIAAKVLVVEPATGGDLVCVCETVRMLQ